MNRQSREQVEQTVSTTSKSVESLLTGETQNVSQVAYNEMADVPVHWIDPVAEVQKNLAHLEELSARLKFMSREIRYLLKI